jgi:uncharacterized protein (DUF1778 family)
MNTPPDPLKDDRIVLRASAADKAKLERAARVAQVSRSQFVLRHALDAAEKILAEQTRFILPDDQFDAFCQRLDEPTRDLPKVRALLDEPSPFGRR